MRRLALGAVLVMATLAHAAPPNAAKLLADARIKAKKEGKNVLVVFHASWCGWCKRFEAMLNDPKLRPSFDGSYVVVRLDVLENPDKKDEENPGGLQVMQSLGGKGAGLPFYAVVAPNGKKLADSLLVPGNAKTNVGYPASTEEIGHIVDLLTLSAPKISGEARSKVATYLKADAAKG